jgi:addiction module HigA family antidote
MTSADHHPGTYLQELLIWHAITPRELSRRTEIPHHTLVELTAARRPIDREISQGLADYFGNSARFWLDLQDRFDNRVGPR